MSHASTGNWVDALLAEWRPIAARLDALDYALWQRATDTSGLGAYRNMWSNAMLARDWGKPWRDVDYTRLRLAIRIDEVLRGRVYALRRSLWSRFYDRAFERAHGYLPACSRAA